MDQGEFLRQIWPRQGFYCIDTPYKKAGFKHHWSTTINEAQVTIEELARSNLTIHHACASFFVPNNRKGANAAFVRSCWLDLDVGDEPNKFATKQEAAAALKTFIAKHRLPRPLIVSSGGGFHAYFTFDNDVAAEVAKETATRLKMLAMIDAFRIDPSRTADYASLLRPVGTLNYKTDPPGRVQAIVDGDIVPFDTFAAAVKLSYDLIPEAALPKAPRKKTVNDEFIVTASHPPSDPEEVANKCQQVRRFRDWDQPGEALSEPVWYASLQVIHFCKDGDETIHRWSEGHPYYDPQQTDAKIAQISGYGPALCSTFLSRNPSGCIGCVHKGKITSPIQLGAVYPGVSTPDRRGVPAVLPDLGADLPPDETITIGDGSIPPPHGFTHGMQGVHYNNGSNPPKLAYVYDMYVDEIAMDEATRKEMCFVRHLLPREGWQSFSFRSADVASVGDFERAMRDNHVKPSDVTLLRTYVLRYMAKVQDEKKMRRLYSSLGWKDETNFFVLGETAYYKDGTVGPVGLSPSITGITKGFTTKGTLQAWVDATTLLDRPGMEAHALMFAAGAGAPLMKFTGFEGALFNVLGRSNTGKTSMARFMMSMYGDFEMLKLKQRDTDNAKIGRLGLFNSLPVYIDEVTNEDAKSVSDFVYEVTQGRSKLRLRIDGTERDTHAWNTIAISSSNSSLAARLGEKKSNPDAERLRLFEFHMGREKEFSDEAAKHLYKTISENYGHAGAIYIQHLVTHQDEVKVKLDRFLTRFRLLAGALSEERMWTASVGCAIYGLHLMRELGLVKLDVDRLAVWAAAQIASARRVLNDARNDPMEILAQYISEFAGNRLTVSKKAERRDGGIEYDTSYVPNGPIYMRYDYLTRILTVQRQHLRKYLSSKQEEWTEFKFALESLNVLLGIKQVSLAAGTGIPSAATHALVFDLGAGAAGSAHLRVVRSDEVIQQVVNAAD